MRLCTHEFEVLLDLPRLKHFVYYLDSKWNYVDGAEWELGYIDFKQHFGSTPFLDTQALKEKLLTVDVKSQ